MLVLEAENGTDNDADNEETGIGYRQERERNGRLLKEKIRRDGSKQR